MRSTPAKPSVIIVSATFLYTGSCDIPTISLDVPVTQFLFFWLFGFNTCPLMSTSFATGAILERIYLITEGFFVSSPMIPWATLAKVLPVPGSDISMRSLYTSIFFCISSRVPNFASMSSISF